MKFPNLVPFFLSLFFIPTFSLSVSAETILERIERTGELNAGTRVDAIPFAYKNEQGEFAGYSVELIKLIHRRLAEKLQKPIKLNLQEVSVDTRFPSVEEERVDLVCGATTITQQRLEKVDFSIPFFMTGSQFLVKMEDASHFNVGGTLSKANIAYIPNTTTDQIIRQIYPFANWKPVQNRAEAVAKLKQGEFDAVASDGILLLGEIVKQGSNPKDFALTPNIPLTTELYACMLPKNNPQWKKFVDESIASPDNTKLQDQWFNPEKGPFPYIIRTNL